MGEPTTNFICAECKAGLVNLPTGLGAVCPNGHGGVVKSIPKEASRFNVRAAKIAVLPKAVLVTSIIAAKKGDTFADRCIYRLAKKDGVYRRVIRASSSLDKHDEKSVLANLRGNAVELIPWEW